MKMQFVVEVEIDQEDEGFETNFVEYLTEEQNPFIGDYGPDAWGGYDGPKVVGVQVSRNGLIKGEWRKNESNI